jgi:hypothetical protein
MKYSLLLFVFLCVVNANAQTIRKCFINNYDSTGTKIIGPTVLDNITTFDKNNNVASIVNYVPCNNATVVKDSLVQYDDKLKSWKLQTYNCMLCADSFIINKTLNFYNGNKLDSTFILNKNSAIYDTIIYYYKYKNNILVSRAKFKLNKLIGSEKYDAIGQLMTTRYIYKLDKKGRIGIMTQKEKVAQKEKIIIAYNANNKISKKTIFAGKLKTEELYYNYDDSLNLISEENILIDKESNIFTSNIIKYEAAPYIKNRPSRIVDENYYVNDIKRARTFYYYKY